MARTKKINKTNKSKKKELSPELDSPQDSPKQSPKKNKNVKSKSKIKSPSKNKSKNNSKIIVEDISKIKSRCSTKINEFIGIAAACEEEKIKDGTERLIGIIAKDYHSVQIHNYTDIHSNKRIMDNQPMVKIQYTNDKVKVIKDQRYNKGTICYKINDPTIISLTPTEIKKNKNLELKAELVNIAKFKELDDGEIGNMIVHVNNASEVTFGNGDDAFTKNKLEIGDLSDALSFLTEHKGVEKGQIIGLFNGFKTSRNQYTNIICPYIMKPDILQKHFEDEIAELEENLENIKTLRPPFNPDEFINCRIRKLNQKREQAKIKQKQ
eukprot:117630_1